MSASCWARTTARDPFLTKLERQLQDADPPAFQLMGELLYVHFLAATSVTKRTKRRNIETVLGWSPDPVSIPPTLEVALDQGVGGAGSGFNTYRYRLLRFLIEFTRVWKTMDSVDRAPIVTDPWKLRAFIERVPGKLSTVSSATRCSIFSVRKRSNGS